MTRTQISGHPHAAWQIYDVEQIAINSKCDLFSEIYGFEVVLARP